MSITLADLWAALPDFEKAGTDAMAVEAALASGGLKAALPVIAQQQADYAKVLTDLGVPAGDVTLLGPVQQIVKDGAALDQAYKAGGYLAFLPLLGPFIQDGYTLIQSVEAISVANPAPASRSNEPEDGTQPPGP
jgi:hypothetical protein